MFRSRTDLATAGGTAAMQGTLIRLGPSMSRRLPWIGLVYCTNRYQIIGPACWTGDTCDAVHGHQQLSLFNAHYNERCFPPIHVYFAGGSQLSAHRLGTHHRFTTSKAVVYVRQSTPHQVITNHESVKLQYALSQRARDLGWREADIDVIDSDLGQSGAAAAHRKGFKKLLRASLLVRLALFYRWT